MKSQEQKVRAKLLDKERRYLSRSLLSEDEREKQKASLKERRSQRTEKEKEETRKKDRERKAKKREEKKKNKDLEDEKKEEDKMEKLLEKDREIEKRSKAKFRDNCSEEEAEFQKIQQLLSMRALREARNGKEHLLDNLKAKREMREFLKHGRSNTFEERSFRDIDEDTIWRKFWRAGAKFKSILEVKKPDIAKRIKEEEELQQKEREKIAQKERENLKAGMWIWNSGTEEYHWTGMGTTLPQKVNMSFTMNMVQMKLREPLMNGDVHWMRKGTDRSTKSGWSYSPSGTKRK